MAGIPNSFIHPKVTIQGAENTIVGDNNSQHIYHSHNYYASPPSNAQKESFEIQPKDILAFYDRETLQPAIENAFKQAACSRLLLVGHHSDWHEGVSERLQNIEFVNKVLTVDIPHDGQIPATKLWHLLFESLGDAKEASTMLFADKGTLQIAVSERLQSITPQQNNNASNLVLVFNVDAASLTKANSAMLQQFQTEWQSMLEMSIAGTEYDRTAPHTLSSRTLILVNAIVGMNPDGDSLFETLAPYIHIQKCVYQKKLQKLFASTASEKLLKVRKRHITDWRKLVDACYARDSGYGNWLTSIQNMIASQFKSERERLPMRVLLERISESDNLKLFKFEKT